MWALSNDMPHALASEQGFPHALAHADGQLYWVDNGNSADGSRPGRLMSSAVDGASLTTLAIADGTPEPALAVGDRRVYWAMQDRIAFVDR